MRAVVALSAVAALAGCASTNQVVQPWTSSPAKAVAENAYFVAEISPVCGETKVVGWTIMRGGCEAMKLTVTNKTAKPVEVNWNKTLYIVNGQTSGGFMFDGIVYRERNAPKTPDLVFPNSALTKTIWPNNLVTYSGGRYGTGWTHDWLPAGDNGVYLTTSIDGKEVGERMTVKLAPSL